MKLTEQLLKNARAPQNLATIKYYQDLPMRLRDRVTGKRDKYKGDGCLQEFSLVIKCLQLNEYENKLCTKEVDVFNKCFKNYLDTNRIAKAQQAKGIITPDAKHLKSRQLNLFLKRFPQPA